MKHCRDPAVLPYLRFHGSIICCVIAFNLSCCIRMTLCVVFPSWLFIFGYSYFHLFQIKENIRCSRLLRLENSIIFYEGNRNVLYLEIPFWSRFFRINSQRRRTSHLLSYEKIVMQHKIHYLKKYIFNVDK